MKLKPSQLPKQGEFIEITERKVSPKVQPLVKVRSRYVVCGTDSLSDGTPVLLIAHPKRKKAILRANAKRFSWRKLTAEQLQEEAFRKECKRSAKQLNEDFTLDEQLKITIFPLIMYRIAWIYSFKAVEESVNNRVLILKKLTRAVRELEKEYRYQINKDLGSLYLRDIERQTEKFLGLIANDMTIFYFTVNREFKLKMPEYPYEELRTYALMAVIIIRIAEEHIREMDKLVASRMHQNKQTLLDPYIKKLKVCMEAFAGEMGKFDYNEYNIGLCKGIFKKNLNKIEFCLN